MSIWRTTFFPACLGGMNMALTWDTASWPWKTESWTMTLTRAYGRGGLEVGGCWWISLWWFGSPRTSKPSTWNVVKKNMDKCMTHQECRWSGGLLEAMRLVQGTFNGLRKCWTGKESAVSTNLRVCGDSFQTDWSVPCGSRDLYKHSERKQGQIFVHSFIRHL